MFRKKICSITPQKKEEKGKKERKVKRKLERDSGNYRSEGVEAKLWIFRLIYTPGKD